MMLHVKTLITELQKLDPDSTLFATIVNKKAVGNDTEDTVYSVELAKDKPVFIIGKEVG